MEKFNFIMKEKKHSVSSIRICDSTWIRTKDLLLPATLCYHSQTFSQTSVNSQFHALVRTIVLFVVVWNTSLPY
jgi:hypothetical protein